MKRKLLSILVLLCLTVSSAWAQEEQEKYLYLDELSGPYLDEDDGTSYIESATLMYGYVPDGMPYFDGSQWLDAEEEPYEDISGLMNLTVDESCQEFEGESLFYLFNGCSFLTTINGIENLNTASVTDMSGMFEDCFSLEKLKISGWNTSNVTMMENMFHGCSGLYELDLSGWNTSNVENMEYMFMDCTELVTIYVGPGWSTEAVTESTDMFGIFDDEGEDEEGDEEGSEEEEPSIPSFMSLPGWDIENPNDKTNAHTGEGGYLTLSDCNVTAKKVGNSYWSTFYTTAGNYQADEGTQVFIVALNGTTLTLTEIEDGIINSGQAVVLKSSSTASIPLSAVESGIDESYYSDNSLKGTMGNFTNTEYYPNIYVLNYKAATGVGFYKLSEGGTISANKAYLESSENAREFFSFDETTAIEAIDNGQLAIDDVVYDLQGRRISQPTKGLYIVNGKKVFINK